MSLQQHGEKTQHYAPSRGSAPVAVLSIDDATAKYAKNTRVHRTGARPDAAEVARRAGAIGATTDSNSRARR